MLSLRAREARLWAAIGLLWTQKLVLCVEHQRLAFPIYRLAQPEGSTLNNADRSMLLLFVVRIPSTWIRR